MTVEAADINDSTVLATTQVETGPGGATLRLLYTLPSGRILSSEYFPADKKREAIFKWIDAVKSAVIADAEEEQAKNLRRHVKPDPELTPNKEVTDRVITETVSPVDYARAQVDSLSQLVEVLKKDLEATNSRLVNAEAALRQWSFILTEFGE